MTCKCNCQCVPSYDVTSIAIDTTTGIATFTLNTTSIASGLFNLKFRCCGQVLSPCWTQTINLAYGTSSTVTNVLSRDGNYATLGQLARQVNVCKIVHCNYTTSPSGNVMILDKLPKCCFTESVSTSPTVITVN